MQDKHGQGTQNVLLPPALSTTSWSICQVWSFHDPWWLSLPTGENHNQHKEYKVEAVTTQNLSQKPLHRHANWSVTFFSLQKYGGKCFSLSFKAKHYTFCWCVEIPNKLTLGISPEKDYQFTSWNEWIHESSNGLSYLRVKMLQFNNGCATCTWENEVLLWFTCEVDCVLSLIARCQVILHSVKQKVECF